MDFSQVEESYPEKESERELHFYYNREERLKNAPQIVRDYYDGKMNPPKGIFKLLVSTKQNRFMLLSIFIFAAFIWIFSFISGKRSSSFLGSECYLEAFSFEETIYASLKISEQAVKEKPLQIPLKVTFFAYDESSMLADKKELVQVFDGSELFIRTKFNQYDIIKISALVETELESKEFTSFVQKR